MDNRISVVINTYNAAKYLVEVLESVRCFDEIVICDMESTDSTLDIARRYGCKIVTFPKGQHRICEPARDFAIHSATNEWVFVVDADEIVPASLRDYLYGVIADGRFRGALAVPRINRFMGQELNGTPDYQLRFFLKQNTVWPATIHSRPKVNGVVKNIPAKRKYSLLHLDDARLSERIGKMNVYSDYEVPKRKNKKYGVGKLILRPAWFFLRSYFMGGGIRNGKKGIVKAYMASMYQIMLLSKLTEAQYDKVSKTVK